MMLVWVIVIEFRIQVIKKKKFWKTLKLRLLKNKLIP